MPAHGHAHLSRETEQRIRHEILPVQVGGESYEFKFESRCRCCNGGIEMLSMINSLLLNGETYSETFRRVVRIDKRKKPITLSSVYKHGQNHIPSSSMAVRKVIEQRSERMHRDFLAGTENLLDEYIYSEVLMKKAFEKFTAEGADVTPRDGLDAAKFLHQIKTGEQDNANLTSVLAQLSEIITAVRATVPEYMFSQILEKLESPQPAVIVPAASPDDEEYDPVVDEDEED